MAGGWEVLLTVNSSSRVFQKKNCMRDKWRQFILHAVHGNPPSIATGRVGALGHIHLICIIEFQYKQVTNSNEIEMNI